VWNVYKVHQRKDVMVKAREAGYCMEFVPGNCRGELQIAVSMNRGRDAFKSFTQGLFDKWIADGSPSNLSTCPRVHICVCNSDTAIIPYTTLCGASMFMRPTCARNLETAAAGVALGCSENSKGFRVESCCR
jgi:hypothetical protein